MDCYVLMYSQSQDCFHIEKASAMLDKNLSIFLKGRSVDYLPLAFGYTVEELHEIKRALIKQRDG